MVALIDYVNSGGFQCHAEIADPDKIDHCWYSSKRNSFGVYEKHEVTRFGAFTSKLKNCTNIKVEVR